MNLPDGDIALKGLDKHIEQQKAYLKILLQLRKAVVACDLIMENEKK